MFSKHSKHCQGGAKFIKNIFQIISVNLNWIRLNPQEVELELNLDWQEEELTYLLFKEAFVKSLFKQHLKCVLANFTFLVKSNRNMNFLEFQFISNSNSHFSSTFCCYLLENSELNWSLKGCQIIF